MTLDTPSFEKQLVADRTARLSAVLAGFAAAMGVVFIALALFGVDAYQSLIAEDGMVEYGSFAFWALAALAGVFGLARKREQSKAQRIVACLLILFFVVCAGEEISWGQRIVGFEGPKELIAINKQQETNLHNIGSISVFSNAFFLLTLGFFLVLPRLADSRGSRPNGLLQHLPVVSPGARRVYLIGFCVWLIIGLRFGTLGFHPFTLWGYYTQMDDEIFELFAAYSFFAFSLLDSLSASKIELAVESI